MLVFHDDKQLVGFGFDEELVAFFTQGTNDATAIPMSVSANKIRLKGSLQGLKTTVSI